MERQREENEGSKERKREREKSRVGLEFVVFYGVKTWQVRALPNPPPDDSSRTRNRDREMNVHLSGEKSEWVGE